MMSRNTFRLNPEKTGSSASILSKFDLMTAGLGSFFALLTSFSLISKTLFFHSCRASSSFHHALTSQTLLSSQKSLALLTSSASVKTLPQSSSVSSVPKSSGQRSASSSKSSKTCFLRSSFKAACIFGMSDMPLIASFRLFSVSRSPNLWSL